ncbi:MAG: prepilin-type N-terminal cleavage/methylation domain-containing protein [Candidatus Saccharimonas sp.]
MTHHQFSHSDGFTILELIVVVVAILILLAVVFFMNLA